MTILDAERLFPQWTQKKRMEWVRAAKYASACKPSYGRLLPLTEEQMTTTGAVLAPRTLRESGL